MHRSRESRTFSRERFFRSKPVRWSEIGLSSLAFVGRTFFSERSLLIRAEYRARRNFRNPLLMRRDPS